MVIKYIKKKILAISNIKIGNNMITEKTKLAEIVKLKNGNEILHKFSVPCVTCPYAKMEMDTLELGQIAKMYGIDLKGLLEELNKKEKQH